MTDTGSGQTGIPSQPRVSILDGKKKNRWQMRDAGLCRFYHCEVKVADIFPSGANPEEPRPRGKAEGFLGRKWSIIICASFGT